MQHVIVFYTKVTIAVQTLKNIFKLSSCDFIKNLVMITLKSKYYSFTGIEKYADGLFFNFQLIICLYYLVEIHKNGN